MPERCIHLMSFRRPSFVILPFIQCHHTRGLALFGGVTKFLYKSSPALFTCEKEMTVSSSWLKRERIFFIMASLMTKCTTTYIITIMTCHAPLVSSEYEDRS